MKDIKVTQASNSLQTTDLAQALESEHARAEQFAQLLTIERVYAEKLARQLRTLTRSRLWRATEWLRRHAGREPIVPDLSRPSFDTDALASSAMTSVFHEIYATNAWSSQDSHSGRGSDLQQTEAIRQALPALLKDFNVHSLLDIPCGDFHWMRLLDLDIDYIGSDVVGDLIAANDARYGNERRRFQVVDIANDSLPRVDLILCRDLLVHFSFLDAMRAIHNLKRSGSTYLLTTTFTDRSTHTDIKTGQWRVINLQLPPFNFPPPLRLIKENCTEQGIDFGDEKRRFWKLKPSFRQSVRDRNDWQDKSLGLWRLADL